MTQIVFDSDSQDLADYLAANPQIRSRHITLIGAQTMIEPDNKACGEITMVQLEMVLAAHGLTETAASAIEAIPDPQLKAYAQIVFRRGTIFPNENPLKDFLKGALGLTEDQYQDLIEEAAGY